MSKKEYYNISKLLETKAQYMMLLGQRANGKSYQVKLTCLQDAYDNDTNFLYLRRWKEDIKEKSVTSYFGDMPVHKITKGEYDKVIAKFGEILFVKYDEEGNMSAKKTIGRYCALNENERYKSQTFINYKYIIYEEFITDGVYLTKEPMILQQFVSTIARDKDITVFLVGNTLTRVCPYFNEWCLDGVLKQKIGTIDIYHYHTENGGNTDIAVEYCTSVKNESNMFFGLSAKQITSGEWEVEEVPKLPQPQKFYDKIYELLIIYNNFKFVMELLVEGNEGGRICYVYPYTKNRKIQRIITDEFSDKPYITKKLDVSKKPEQMIYECLRLEKVCYSDNLTGSDFKGVLDKLKMI